MASLVSPRMRHEPMPTSFSLRLTTPKSSGQVAATAWQLSSAPSLGTQAVSTTQAASASKMSQTAPSMPSAG